MACGTHSKPCCYRRLQKKPKPFKPTFYPLPGWLAHLPSQDTLLFWVERQESHWFELEITICLYHSCLWQTVTIVLDSVNIPACPIDIYSICWYLFLFYVYPKWFHINISACPIGIYSIYWYLFLFYVYPECFYIYIQVFFLFSYPVRSAHFVNTLYCSQYWPAVVRIIWTGRTILLQYLIQVRKNSVVV